MTRDAAMKHSRGLAALVTLVFLVVLIRTAWVSDDALISLRTVLNVTHGYGLTFNIVERVQTFTHPLWLFAITAVYLVVRNIYVAVFTLSIGASLWAFWIAVRNAASPIQAWLAAGVLVFSHAFMDFATSGLENPLSNLLFAAHRGAGLQRTIDPRRRLTGLWLCLSGLYLTRPDDVLWRCRWCSLASVQVRRIGAIARAAAIGLAARVRLDGVCADLLRVSVPQHRVRQTRAGISRGEMWTQGVLYLVDSIDRDPITLLVIAFGAVLARRRARR